MAPVIRLPRSRQPRASILIVARRNSDLLARCLSSLARHLPASIPTETVIVLNDAAPEVTALVTGHVSDAVVVRSDVNLGFPGANNCAARAASGEFVVLLNDDTEIAPGWLEPLLRAAETHEDVGAVGSRILFPDGTLQEAGSIVWSDGSTAPIGRGLRAGTPRYLALRDVDYCSGCSLLVRRSTWDAIGGFDEEYFPIYYEDTDLCMAIHARGERVLYTASSRLLHHESSSTDAGFKRFLFARNGARFRAKWAERLAGHEAADPSSAAAIERAIRRAGGMRRRVLVIDDRVPDPRLGSGFSRMRDILQQLARTYAVTLAVTAGAPDADDELADAGIELACGSPEDELGRPEALYDAVVISRPHNHARAAEAVRRLQPHAAMIYDAEALFCTRLDRQLAIGATADPVALAREAAAMRTLETRIAAEADAVVALSDEEAAFFAGAAPASVAIVRHALDSALITEGAFAERGDMAFVAGWLGGELSPNVEAVRWFTADVLPRIRAEVPWARVLVTGLDPPASVRALASESVVLVGCQPDLREFYNGVRVAVAPVRYGAGVKTKTVEAIQYGVPVVATPQGAEGIDLCDADAVRVADDPDGFASAAARLLTDRNEWERAHAACRATIERWKQQPRDTWHAVVDRALLGRATLDVAARARRALGRPVDRSWRCTASPP